MELSMPIRIRWDIDHRGRRGRAKRIARAIREAAPLQVELRIHGPRGLSDLSAVVAEIHAANARIEATIGLFPEAVAATRWGYPVDFVWAVEGPGAFGSRLPEGARAVSFTPDEDTIDDLPEVLTEFAGSRAAVLHLPNVNAVRAAALKGHVSLPGPERIRKAVREIASRGPMPGGKSLVVHDYFLWRGLREAFPASVGERVEYSGCQAGSALAYVDWEGNVYPCDSLPIRLGSLIETPLEEIWRSPSRSRILSSIRALPGACGGCPSSVVCLGGCRGLAYVASESFDAADPGCPEGKGRIPGKGADPSA